MPERAPSPYTPLRKHSGAHVPGPIQACAALALGNNRAILDHIVSDPLAELTAELDDLGVDAPAIRRSIERSLQQQRRILEGLPARLSAPSEYGLVVFGSTARGEATSESDVDWTLLIDGQARAEHRAIAHDIEKTLRSLKMVKPRAGGAFGSMAFSHDIIHKIGGEGDSNRNLTQRTLLILESVSIGGDVVRRRVIRLVLQRYVQDETSFLTDMGKKHRIPRFLLNDIVRFWRTIAVDYASKRIERGKEGWAIRNAKLRFSRKLLFVAGFLVCMAPSLAPTEKLKSASTPDEVEEALVDLLVQYQDRVPLTIVVRMMRKLGDDALARDLLEAYDSFVNLVDTERESLTKVDSAEVGGDPVFARVRRESHRFQGALTKLFFESSEDLTELTKRYGVF